MIVDLGRFRRGVRAAMIFAGRGGTTGLSMTSFAAKPASTVDLRNRLDRLHAQVRVTGDARRLCDLVDEYLLVAATLARTQAGGTPNVLEGAVLSAAVSATENTGPVVMGDNLAAPTHSLA